MKYLIAGFGSIGRRHFRNLKSLGETDFVFYRSKMGTLDDGEIAEYPVETKLSTALDHKPDVVIVSNPTALHLDVAIPSARRGCHLFIEKPLSHSMDGVKHLQEIVLRNDVKVLVGFQFRFHPQLIHIKELLGKNAIGDLISVHVDWGEYLPGWHPWEDYRESYSGRKDLGGGVVLTLSHPIDYLRWLLGDIESLWAYTSKVKTLEIDVVAVAEIGVKFASGVVGNIHLDYIQNPNSHFMKIVGSNGIIQWDYHKGSLIIYKNSSIEPVTFPLPAGFERNDMFCDQMEHLDDLLRNDAISRCSLGDGIKVQEIIQGIENSASRGVLYRFPG